MNLRADGLEPLERHDKLTVFYVGVVALLTLVFCYAGIRFIGEWRKHRRSGPNNNGRKRNKKEIEEKTNEAPLLSRSTRLTAIQIAEAPPK